MQFNHDNMVGTLLAVDLVNLASREAGSIEEALRDHGIRRPAVAGSACNALSSWIEELREAFAATGAPERCNAVNRLLELGTSRAYLTMHDGFRPHLHFASDEDDVVSRVKAVTAGSLAVFTVESGGDRLGICQRMGCARAFVDMGRNSRRRYCTARCGNYDAMQRHRGRTSDGHGAWRGANATETPA